MDTARILGTDWLSALAWDKSIQLNWETLIEKLDLKFAIFKGCQELSSDNGSYSTLANLSASRRAGIPINACYYWHFPDGNMKYYLQIYARAIEAELPQFIGVDIEQTRILVNGEYQQVDPQKMSDTAQELCEGLQALFPSLRVVPYTRQDIITYYSPPMKKWIGKFDGSWVAGWPDYGEYAYPLTWEQIAAGKMLSAYDKSVIDIDDFDPPILAGQTSTKIWQYSSRIRPPTQGFPYDHQYDWNVFYGSLDDMKTWIRKEDKPMATQLYNPAVKQADRGTVFTWRPNQALKVSPTELGASAVILRMAGYNVWDTGHSHMPITSEPTFKGRFKQMNDAGIPVIGRYEIHGGRWGMEQFGKETLVEQSCGGEMDEAQKEESCRNNLVLPSLLTSWCNNSSPAGSFTMDSLFSRRLKWLDIKMLEISSTETEGFKGQNVNDFWQTLSFNHLVRPLKWLILRGYVPNVPIALFTGPWWLKLYPNDFSIMLDGAKDWLYLHLGEWTQLNTRVFPTLEELWAFRPDDSFKLTSYPEGYHERILMHEYSDQRQRVSGQLTDASGNPTEVSLSLWNDTRVEMAKFLGATVPIEPPPTTTPREAELEAELEKWRDWYAAAPK